MQDGTKYSIKRSGSDEQAVMVHADDMNMFNRAPPRSDDEQQVEAAAAADPAAEPAAVTPAVAAKKSSKSKFQVAEIMDERGRLQGGGDHQYLIRWEGTQDNGAKW